MLPAAAALGCWLISSGKHNSQWHQELQHGDTTMHHGETKRRLVHLLFRRIMDYGSPQALLDKGKGKTQLQTGHRVLCEEWGPSHPMEWEALLRLLWLALVFQRWPSSRSLLLIFWPGVKWMKLPGAGRQHRLSTIVTQRDGAVTCQGRHSSLSSSLCTRHWKGRRTGCSVWSWKVWLPLCVFTHLQGSGLCTVCNQFCLSHLLSLYPMQAWDLSCLIPAAVFFCFLLVSKDEKGI